MNSRRISQALSILVSTLLTTGCTVGQFHRLGPQSHFSFPNSNVKDLGPVNVKLTGTSSLWIFPSFMTSEVDQKVFNAAISEVDGADLVLDYARTTIIKEFLGIYWTEEYLEGTAARMEVGQQHLR